MASEAGGAIGGIGNFLSRATHRGIGADALQQKLAVSRDHHQQIIEVMGNAAGQTADRFHLLGLPKLLFERPMLSDILGEEFEESRIVFVANSSPGEPHGDGNAVLAHPIGNQPIEALRGAKMVGDYEPLLRVRVQIG